MQNRSYKTKEIVEAGLTSAIIIVLMLLSMYVPIFVLIGSLVLPVPVTILYIRHRFKVALTAVIISGIFGAFLINPLTSLTTVFLFGIIGLTLGYCIDRKAKFSTTIVLLAAASFIGTMVSILVYAYLIDKGGIVGMINNYQTQIKESIDISKSMYAKMGVNKQQMDQVEQMFKMLNSDFIYKVIPGLLILSSFFSAYLNYVVSKGILKRLGYEIREAVPFTKIYIPNILGAGLIIIYCIGLLLTTRKIPAGEYIANSTQIVFQFAFMIDGVAVASYYLENKFRLSKLVIVLIVIFTFFSSPLNIIYLYVGLADLIFDFRKLDPNRLIKR